MPFYTKPVSELDSIDLQELLDEQAAENARLEFKLIAPDKDDTLKKLSSFANTFGGFMVIGAKADSKDGRLLEVPGVDPVSSYKQKVVDWCFAGASPPITVEVSDPIPAPPGGGKVCYVIYVPESDVAPHFLNGRKGVWVRTDEFSARFGAALANDVELRHLLDRRQFVRECRAALIARAKKRFHAYLGQKHADRSGNKTDTGPLLELCIVPRFPSRLLCDQSTLVDSIEKTGFTWRGVAFPNTRGDVLTQYESAIVLDPVTSGTSFFEANVWGGLLYAATLHSETPETAGIQTHRFAGLVLLFLHHANKVLEELGYSGPLVIESTISPVLKVQWLHGMHGYPVAAGGSPLDDNVAFTVHTSTEILRQKFDGVAMDVLRPVLYAVNWRALAAGHETETILRLGYEFNRWKAGPPRA